MIHLIYIYLILNVALTAFYIGDGNLRGSLFYKTMTVASLILFGFPYLLVLVLWRVLCRIDELLEISSLLKARFNPRPAPGSLKQETQRQFIEHAYKVFKNRPYKRWVIRKIDKWQKLRCIFKD